MVLGDALDTDRAAGAARGGVASHRCVSECHFVPVLIRLLSDTPGSQARIRPLPDWAARSSATVRPCSVPKRGPYKPMSRSEDGLPPAAGSSDSVKVRVRMKEPKEPP